LQGGNNGGIAKVKLLVLFSVKIKDNLAVGKHAIGFEKNGFQAGQPPLCIALNFTFWSQGVDLRPSLGKNVKMKDFLVDELSLPSLPNIKKASGNRPTSSSKSGSGLLRVKV